MKVASICPSFVSIFLLTFFCCVFSSPASADAMGGGASDISPERPGLSVLLPAQSFAVQPAQQLAHPQELAQEPLDEDPFAAVPPEPQTAYQLQWQPGVDWTPGTQSFASSRQGRSRYRLGTIHSSQGWMADTGRFTYMQDNGSTVSIGQVAEGGGFWGSSARLGGVQVTRLPGLSSRGTLMPGSFGMSASVGRVSHEDLARTGAGGLTVGAPMAASTLRYGLTADITLETHLENAIDTSEKGLGGMIAMGDWGALRLSTTQTQDVFAQSQRSGLGLQVKLDQQEFESTYETLNSGAGTLEQKLGFKHSWFISAQTRMQIGGDRELSTGNYSMKMQLSVPFDVFVTQWWRE